MKCYWYHQHDVKTLRWITDCFFLKPLGDKGHVPFFDENYSWQPFSPPSFPSYYEYWTNFEMEEDND